jgi:hypothetical protein
MTNACKTNTALRILLTRPSNTVRSDHCDIHRLIPLHLLYSCAVQSIFIEPIGWYMRWGDTIVPSLLYDDQDSKSSSSPGFLIL